MEIKRNGKILANVEPSENKKEWVVTKEETYIMPKEKLMSIIEESEKYIKTNQIQIDDIKYMIANARYILRASERYYDRKSNNYIENTTFDMCQPKAKIKGNDITFDDGKQTYRMEITNEFSINVWSHNSNDGVTSDGKELKKYFIALDKEENGKVYSYNIDIVMAI